jgi:hypothetical protein
MRRGRIIGLDEPHERQLKDRLLLWLVGIFLLTFTLSLALFGVIVLLLPPRYFSKDRSRFLADKPPLVRWLGIFGKNVLGLVLIALGIVLSIPGVPGQGLLTILVGVVLLDIPGKHRLVRYLANRPGILRGINRFRSWFGRPPMVVDAAIATSGLPGQRCIP